MRNCLDSCPLAHIMWRVFSLNLLPLLAFFRGL